MASAGDHPWFQAHPLSHEHIVWHWEQATPDEVAQGMRWYRDAHHVATVIANGNAHLGAGMLAVYSPQQGWIGNVHNAATVLHAGKGIGGPGSGIFATTAQKRAADRLIAGERYDVILNGPKIRDFARLIEFGGDQDPCDPRAVIDRHALSVAHGCRLSAEEYDSAPIGGFRRRDGSISRHQYDYVVDLYRRAADVISGHIGQKLSAHQVQAVTWLVRQRLNRRAEQQRGLTDLDKGRNRMRANSECSWNEFRALHFPGLSSLPSAGYQSAA